MPQDNFVYDHILIRYGELSTKGKNRKDFIKKLFNNVKNALSGFPALDYEKTHDRMYIHLNGEDPFQVKTYLEKVFGISSFWFAATAISKRSRRRRWRWPSRMNSGPSRWRPDGAGSSFR